MEKSIERELWVCYRHPQSKAVAVTWFASDEYHTATEKALAFIASPIGRHGRIIEGAKTAEEAIKIGGKIQ